MVDTRESNSQWRPGAPDMANKRRTPAQVKADKQAAKEAKEKEVRAKQQARKRIAQAEDQMAIEDMKEVETRNANSTRPRRGRAGKSGAVQDAATEEEDQESEAKLPNVANTRRTSARQKSIAASKPEAKVQENAGNGAAQKSASRVAASAKNVANTKSTPVDPKNKQSRKRARSESEESTDFEYLPEDGSEAPTPGPKKGSRRSDSEEAESSDLTDLELTQPADRDTPKPQKKKRHVGGGKSLREEIQSERTVTATTKLPRTERGEDSEPQLDVEMRDIAGGHTGPSQGARVGTQPGAMTNRAKYAATLATFSSGSARRPSTAPSSRASSVSTLPSSMRTRAVPRTPFAGHREPEVTNESDVPEEPEEGGIVSEDETAEHHAARASPEKTPVARLTTKALVRVSLVDVTATPTQAERRAGSRALPRKVNRNNIDEDNAENAASKSQSQAKLPSKGTGRKDTESQGTTKGSVDAAGQADERGSKTAATKTRVSQPDSSSSGDNLAPSTYGRDGDGHEGSGGSGDEAKLSGTKTGRKDKGSEKKKAKWTTKDLPDAAHADNRWRKVFVPTLIRYMGTRTRPWAWEDHSSVNVVQMIWDAVYGETDPRVISFNDPIHFCATQRLYDWRKAIGYWAAQVLDNFFDNDPQFSSITAREEYCAAMIEGNDFRFVYERPFDEKKGALFQNVYILRVLASHLDKTNGAVDVPGLYANSRADVDRPIGVIALAAAAVERILELWASAEFKGYNNHKHPVFKARINQTTGEEVLAVSKFCTDVWLDPTNGFADSADNLSSTDMADIVSHAMSYSTITQSQKKITLSSKSDSRRRLVSDK